MSEILYCFDSGALMTAHRSRYPFDMFSPVWAKLEETFRNGRVFLCKETFAEIKLGDDLHDWARERKKENPQLVRATSTEIFDLAGAIQRAYIGACIARALPKRVKIRLSEIDFMIVAHAKNAGAVVVTEEVRSGNPYGQKIPNVCEKERVRWINFLQFMRNENYRF